MKPPSQFIVSCKPDEIIFQPQAKQNAGIGSKRDGRVAFLNCPEGGARDACAIRYLRRGEPPPKPSQSQVFSYFRQPALKRWQRGCRCSSHNGKYCTLLGGEWEIYLPLYSESIRFCSCFIVIVLTAYCSNPSALSEPSTTPRLSTDSMTSTTPARWYKKPEDWASLSYLDR